MFVALKVPKLIFEEDTEKFCVHVFEHPVQSDTRCTTDISIGDKYKYLHYQGKRRKEIWFIKCIEKFLVYYYVTNHKCVYIVMKYSDRAVRTGDHVFVNGILTRRNSHSCYSEKNAQKHQNGS